MGKIECEVHRTEMEFIKQIADNVSDVKDIVTDMNGRVRETEQENAEQRTMLKSHDKSIDNIKKTIWTTVVAIIGGLFTWLTKVLAGK